MTSSKLVRPTDRFLLLLAFAAAFVPAATAQTNAPDADDPNDVSKLDNYVVTATRTAQAIDKIPSSAAVFTPADWKNSQLPSLANVLGTVAGVTVTPSGATGGGAAVFMRGSESYETLLLVDGVRMNDRSSIDQPFIGGASLSNIGRIEVVRGPQSPLYGGSAMGGIVSFETARGAGRPTATLEGEAGSFASWTAAAQVQGETAGLSFSAGAERTATDNDRPMNAFAQTTASTRLEWAASPKLTVGGTFRLQRSDYEEPGDIGPFAFPGAVEFAQNLGTVFARLAATDSFSSKLTLAAQLRDYVLNTASGPGTPTHHTRGVLDWQNEWEPHSSLQLVAGFNYEGSELTNGGVSHDDALRAVYVSGFWQPVEGATITAGVRRDDYDTAGAATPYRFGVARHFARTGTKLRATYGTAFTAPGMEDRYGSAFQPANAAIRPEHSRGWDAGVDQTWLSGKLAVSATYFANDYSGKFGYDATFATINIARAKARGVELEAHANWAEWTARAAQTWTDTEDESTKLPLLRRPRSVFTAGVERAFGRAVRIGAGVTWIADREDLDPSTFVQVGAPDYVVARVYGAWTVRPNLRVTGRIENLFDEKYQAVLGYPALPVGAFGGLEWTF